ncbi:MAG TPA: SDR family NAD(P)-dependent oxidoreductase [Actinomycetota bacterium]|nr:SDR family NAD(P)-dependent oxidoreductase [Actinomycetota bacterium]
MKLERGMVAVITGASRGIGVYLAEALARAGLDVALAARTEDALEDVARRVQTHGVRALPITTDVTKLVQLRQLVSRTTKELGPIDLLVNNAGIELVSHFATTDPEVISSTITTNLTAAELLTRLVVPQMIERRRGHIVNMASLSAKGAYPYSVVYASTKHAMVGFSWSLREELRPYGIGVTAICPSHVEDVGLFADRHPDNRSHPLVPPVAPGKVAEATIRAIEKNKAEVVVARGLGKIADVISAISPDFNPRILRRTGFYDFLARDASKTTPPP